MRGKLIIISAPSGTGKSTIISWLMKEHPELNLAFSVSCTSRAPRGAEQNGVEYFFLTPEEFKAKIQDDEFLEYEEVYEGRFYGTLKSQVERQLEAGQNVVFDVDVKGGVNIKKYYGDEALSLFIQPDRLPYSNIIQEETNNQDTQYCFRCYKISSCSPRSWIYIAKSQRRNGNNAEIESIPKVTNALIPSP